MKDPQTKEEWQVAVDGANFWLAFDSCFQYGFMVSVNIDEKTGKQKPGRPSKKSGVDVERCRDLIERGKKLGITPKDILK